MAHYHNKTTHPHCCFYSHSSHRTPAPVHCPSLSLAPSCVSVNIHHRIPLHKRDSGGWQLLHRTHSHISCSTKTGNRTMDNAKASKKGTSIKCNYKMNSFNIQKGTKHSQCVHTCLYSCLNIYIHFILPVYTDL